MAHSCPSAKSTVQRYTFPILVDGESCLKTTLDWIRTVADEYIPEMKPIPCTSGRVRSGVDPAELARLTFTEKAPKVSVVRVVPLPSSTAERMIESIPIGCTKSFVSC